MVFSYSFGRDSVRNIVLGDSILAVSLSNCNTVVIRNSFTVPGGIGENQTSIDGALVDVRSLPNNLIELKVLQGNTLKTVVLDDAARTVTQFKEAAPSGFSTPQADLQVQRVNDVTAIYREILTRNRNSVTTVPQISILFGCLFRPPMISF